MKVLQANVARHESKADGAVERLHAWMDRHESKMETHESKADAAIARLETNVYRTFVAAVIAVTAVLSLGIAVIAVIAFLPS